MRTRACARNQGPPRRALPLLSGQAYPAAALCPRHHRWAPPAGPAGHASGLSAAAIKLRDCSSGIAAQGFHRRLPCVHQACTSLQKGTGYVPREALSISFEDDVRVTLYSHKGSQACQRLLEASAWREPCQVNHNIPKMRSMCTDLV